MRKVSLVAAILAFGVFGTSAYADDNSMSQWTGNSYQAFEAARAGSVVVPKASPGQNPDNGMSRWNGNSYAAFESVRTSPVTISVAEVRATRLIARQEPPSQATGRGRSPVSPFRDDTGA